MILFLMLGYLFSSFVSNNSTAAAGLVNFTGNFTDIGTFTNGSVGNGGVSIGVASTIASLAFGSASVIFSTILKYGYTSLFIFMILDSASLPPPSELIIVPAGFLASTGGMDIGLAFLWITAGGIIGMCIDYLIGYHVGRRVVERNASFLKLSKNNIKEFENWFNKNGMFAVFILRIVPGLRAWISILAGAARMNTSRFLFFSIMGSLVYNYLLLIFGYYLISIRNTEVIIGSIAAFVVIAYIAYEYSVRRILKESMKTVRNKTKSKSF